MESNEITLLLKKWKNGDKKALGDLIPIVYRELHLIAQNRLNREKANHTLQATELVNEAFMRLDNWQHIDWQNRAHFFAISASIMRNILVDYAREQFAAKRGGRNKLTIPLDEVTNLVDTSLADKKELDLIILDEALKKLEVIDKQQSRIIELRYFGGLSIEETAEVMEISTATISREWRLARMWLMKELKI